MKITEKNLIYFFNTIKQVSSYDFTEYSEKSLRRRLERILAENNIDFEKLILKIKQDSTFLEQMVKDITVNTTELFRDPEVWQEIRYKILTKLKSKSEINIWHAGCSTGQEVYSLAIMLNELGVLDKCNIYASDLNLDVLKVAKKGEYRYRFNLSYLSNFDKVIKENKYNYAEKTNVDYNKYFSIDPHKDKITIHEFLRKKPIFSKKDLTQLNNFPSEKFDLILCRNVLIYFNLNLQNKVIDSFYKTLKTDGFLILGKHESLLGYPEDKFNKKGKFYQKKGNKEF